MERKRRMKLAITVLTGLLSLPSLAATPEVRGTWLTTTGVDHIKTGNNTADVISDLRAIGLNTVYVEAWKNGYTNFPSQTLADLTGGPDRSTFLGRRDLLAETTVAAHRNNMIHVAWFEYGFSSQFIGSGGNPNNPLSTYMKNQGWLLQDVNGNYGNASNGFAWMNPAVPEVRQFLIDLVIEAVQQYDLDGVQFDDRLAWPTQFGWDQTTKNIYLAETGRTLSNNPNTSQLNLFNDWRQLKVQQFADQLTAAVRLVRPDIHLSVSPSITPFSKDNYNADWPDWVQANLFDSYVPQAYRDSISAFNAIVNAQIAPFDPGKLDQLVMGLRSNGSGASTPISDLLQMIDRTRSEGIAGHSIWYSANVRDLFASQLTTYYNVAGTGQADNPMFTSDHRPDEQPGSDQGDGLFRFVITEGHAYTLIARDSPTDDWSLRRSAFYAPGTHDLYVPDAFEAALLIDLRPGLSIEGDLDGDGEVGVSDLDTLLRNFGAVSRLGDSSVGELTGDAFVDADDLGVLIRNFGSSSPVGVANVPEPASAVLVCSLLLLGRSRQQHGAERRGVSKMSKP